MSPKVFELVRLLVARRPRALSKEEIHRALWPDVFVSDGTLTSLAAEARSAIGDDARRPKFVRTVHGYGYAFAGEAEEERASVRGASAARHAWRLFWGTREIALEEGECVLGRDPAATVLVDHRSVSRRHACIRLSASNATLEDLGSKNGTWLRGRRLERRAALQDGDEIRLGSIKMTFRVFSLPDSTETTAEP